MQHISLFLLLACLFSLSPLAARASEIKQEATKDLRILKLLPNLLCPLAVEPGIPDNFIALSPSGTLDPYDWIYWGPEKVLKAYFKNPASLKEPILRVKLSAEVAQAGPNSFDKSFMEFIKKFQKENPEGFDSIEMQWGDYPILAIRFKEEDRLMFSAWVGLNDPEAGWTLVFGLVCPDKKGHPNMKDRKLWESLLIKTTQLKDGDYFKALGQDLQDGYTLLNVGGAKLKMMAEKRQSDGRIQVVVIPESSDIKFDYIDMEECLMGAKWRYKEPMVKVFGGITVNNNNFISTTNCITSIFFKDVVDFSVKKEDGQKSLIFQKICDEID